jgi:transposase
MNTAKQTESLKIDYNVRQLVVKAMNQSKSQHEVADKLKVSVRSLRRYIKHYELKQTNKVWN